jgi:hypothetical protein
MPENNFLKISLIIDMAVYCSAGIEENNSRPSLKMVLTAINFFWHKNLYLFKKTYNYDNNNRNNRSIK